MTQNNLGIAWWNLPTGDRNANLRHTIACYEAALRVFTERAFSREHAQTMANLRAAHETLDALSQEQAE